MSFIKIKMTENLKHFFEIYYLGFPASYKETESAINYEKLGS